MPEETSLLSESPDSDDDIDDAQEEGKSAEGWRASLPEDLRDHPSLAPIKDIASLAKSYIHAQKLVGAEKVVLPSKTSPPETWNEFYNKLGRPQDPTGYQLEGLDDEDLGKEIKSLFHRSGLSQRQAEEIWKGYQAIMEAQSQELEESAKREAVAAETELKKAWGAEFPKKLEAARRVASTWTPDLLQAIDDSGLGNNPEFLDFLARVGENLIEDRMVGAKTAGRGYMTPMEATAELDKIYADPNHPIFHREHPQHHKAVEEVKTLWEIKMGGVK
jgi:hypothetical protein